MDIATRRVRTLLTCVARVHQNDRYSRRARFVFDERSQLCECPIAVPRSLVSTFSPCPRANARQFFQGNRAIRALRRLHETLANLMIDVFLKSSLATCQLAQVAFSRQGAARLQIRTKLLHFLAIALNGCAGVDIPVAVSGDVGHTHDFVAGGDSYPLRGRNQNLGASSAVFSVKQSWYNKLPAPSYL